MSALRGACPHTQTIKLTNFQREETAGAGTRHNSNAGQLQGRRSYPTGRSSCCCIVLSCSVLSTSPAASEGQMRGHKQAGCKAGTDCSSTWQRQQHDSTAARPRNHCAGKSSGCHMLLSSPVLSQSGPSVANLTVSSRWAGMCLDNQQATVGYLAQQQHHKAAANGNRRRPHAAAVCMLLSCHHTPVCPC